METTINTDLLFQIAFWICIGLILFVAIMLFITTSFPNTCFHKYKYHKDYALTYQEMICTKCGKKKIIKK